MRYHCCNLTLIVSVTFLPLSLPQLLTRAFNTFPTQNQDKPSRITRTYIPILKSLCHGMVTSMTIATLARCNTAASPPKLVVTKLRTRTGPKDQLRPGPKRMGQATTGLTKTRTGPDPRTMVRILAIFANSRTQSQVRGPMNHNTRTRSYRRRKMVV